MCCAPARASVITFAQFQEATGAANENLFAYLDNSPASGESELATDPSGNVGGAIPVTFSYGGIAGLPADLQGPQAATLSLTLTSNDSAGSFVGLDAQEFDSPGVLGLLTITRDTPAAEGSGTQTDLLSVGFLAGELYGVDGSTNPTLIAGDSDGLPILYASDFLNFTNLGNDDDLNLAFTSWTTTFNGNGLEIGTDGFFFPATAAAAGVFDIDSGSVSIPEPDALAALVGALLLLGGWRGLSRGRSRAAS
ncbi:MAG TPA: hypothetical protein VL992_20295 [Tepidisphaeraceae bacterium]|nr:hypothetical protein [Tepidisphaeraceae bacterium]